MTTFLVYMLKTGILLVVFCLFFKLFLASERCHRLCRVLLLSTILLSFVLPLCIIRSHRTMEVGSEMFSPAVVLPAEQQLESSEPMLIWMPWVAAIYFAGVAFMFGKTLLGLWSVARLVRKGQHEPQYDGTVMVRSTLTQMPFSWFQYIVLPPDDFSERNELIVAHEKAHCSMRHSVDVLLVDLLSAWQWFNPAMWLLRMDLRTVHEFEADRAVISQGVDAYQYQTLLIRKTVAHGGYSMVNGFTHSTLKQRIDMIQRKERTRWGRLKALYVVPVTLVALAINAEEVIDYKLKAAPSIEKQLVTAVAHERITTSEKLPQTEEQQIVGDNPDTIRIGRDTMRIDKGCFKGEPLIVIDGKIVSSEEMNGLSPEIIQSVDVLKGDAATAQYGEKGANGVVVIMLKTSGNTESGNAGLLLQSPVTKETLAEEAPDEFPEFPGGEKGLMEFLRDNLQYPSLAVKLKAEGRVLVSCVITEKGDVSKVRLEKGVEPNLDKEAIRVVKKMPRWKPGKKAGKPVSVKYCIPVSFRLK